MLSKKMGIKSTILYATAMTISLANVQANAGTTPLYAGQNQLVGTVNTSYSNGNIVVDYRITESGWCLGKTHVYVGESAPQKSAPGSFPYIHEELGCTQTDTFVIPMNACAYISAHAEVHHWTIPFGSSSNYSVSRPLSESYLQGNVTVNGISQSYPSWCVDLDHYIYLNKQYSNCTISSSLAYNAPVDKPSHLDSVNYVIYMADSYPEAGKNEIQAAIWTLIDDRTPTSPMGTMTWNQALVNDIVADALVYGEGFVTPYEGETAVIMYCGPSVQVTIFQSSMANAYIGEETAWARGDLSLTNKGGRNANWSSYFQVCP